MINPTQAAQHAAQNQSAGKSQTSAVTSDFETFLLMMTTQAQNQDPLEPMDSSDYASQLAQFSMVEQQVKTNDLLSALATAMGNVNLDELASWVGMDVRSASAFHFDDEPVTLFTEPNPKADKTTLVIRDEEGTVIDRITVPVADTEFVWAGTDSAGNPLASGTYSATLESYENGKLLSEKLASSYQRVIEAQAGDDAVVLTLEGGLEILATKVTAIRTGA
ncbi:flagellar hook capping FlgD N-terminal domain-containing protein [Ruegeria sp. EL01]|jgi:flagellar basal-body rod modification protein FlgD|uniref:flagellar hook capping FlgD N-terminal domain-containing protein n=1 Tax=Ruegeria sp. EL01 TaxID=2107578 RepID=UPI000EA80670|nr:flagellar hook capping FlgD N-terminal domain-containing protein [Ruegeria sp. EL01]